MRLSLDISRKAHFGGNKWSNRKIRQWFYVKTKGKWWSWQKAFFIIYQNSIFLQKRLFVDFHWLQKKVFNDLKIQCHQCPKNWTKKWNSSNWNFEKGLTPQILHHKVCTQFWDKYIWDGRENLQMLLSGFSRWVYKTWNPLWEDLAIRLANLWLCEISGGFPLPL